MCVFSAPKTSAKCLVARSTRSRGRTRAALSLLSRPWESAHSPRSHRCPRRHPPCLGATCRGVASCYTLRSKQSRIVLRRLVDSSTCGSSGTAPQQYGRVPRPSVTLVHAPAPLTPHLTRPADPTAPLAPIRSATSSAQRVLPSARVRCYALPPRTSLRDFSR